MNGRPLSRYLKFLPLVALFAFGVVLISMPRGTEAVPVGAPSVTLTVVPLQGTTVVTAMYSDDNPVGSGNAVLTASPAIGSFLAGATVSVANGETVTVSGATVTVTEDADTVSAQKTLTATFQCTTPGITTFTISHGNVPSSPSVAVICDGIGAGYPGYGAGYPYYGGYPGYNNQYPSGTYPNNYTTATNVTVSASPASTTCSSPSSISVTVKDANGNIAPDGTSVTVSASTGTISPNVVSTSGGYATTSFAAPNNANGTATVTAASGQGTGYATVAFTCTGASTTASAAPVYPPSYPTYTGPAVIMPPNTGDAGLAGNARSSSYAGLALVTLSVIGFGAGAYSLRRQRTER